VVVYMAVENGRNLPVYINKSNSYGVVSNRQAFIIITCASSSRFDYLFSTKNNMFRPMKLPLSSGRSIQMSSEGGARSKVTL
jgi:hypothetical protein